ncbi:uncharacterized protein LOC122938780 isoform X2 [Bufo gargarizans]|uniref:uncharacterized protein LOC122938780 isoform X2 n=1 Tax=Bufo gargarizans TaxID=30331 RepID=UPI001CF2DC5D|nr:uncharacterized protein LOC122938780 isoform X2 [Bufo gargarizans]
MEGKKISSLGEGGCRQLKRSGEPAGEKKKIQSRGWKLPAETSLLHTMTRAPACAIIVLLSIWGSTHGGGARPEGLVRPAPNLALQGIATQSSTYSYFGSARNANDGSLAANYLRSQCSYTKKELDPWWMVDLKAPYRIMSVAITNRVLECCRDKIFGSEIRLGNNPSNGGKLNPRCGVISSIESGETLSFSCQGMVGQYVTVTIPGREEQLVLCEVQVYGFPAEGSDYATPTNLKTLNGAPNVAPKGLAKQSSLYNMYGEPKNAIDGSLDSNYLYIQCAGTSEQENPWWMVDLKSEYKVFTVAVTNRGDCCPERIHGAEIMIGNSDENAGTKNPRCGVITSMDYGQTLAFECDGMEGRYVSIFIPGANRSVTICEVQVFGLPSDKSDEQASSGDFPDSWNLLKDYYFDGDSKEEEVLEYEGDNLAFRGITSQSSTYDKFGASKNAIDGSPSTIYMSGRCSHTDLDVEPWWMVDLINVYNITKVKITNRGDCCQERINGAVIIIGNSPENGGTQNSRCAKIKSLGLREEGQYVCGMVGRYITITIPGKAAYLTLCEVKVYGTNVSEQYTGAPSKPDLYDSEEQQRDNLAFRGITSQSSTYDKLGASENAIDGSPSTNYMSGRCSHTDLDVEPWWMVDLINVYNITKVKITNRGDCCQERINGAVIIIGNSPENGGTQNSRCAKIKSLGLREEGQYVCGMVGRYITITIPGKAAYLTLCEVKVYGTNVSEQYTGAPSKPDLYDSEEQQRDNLAFRGITSQSSTYDKFGASKNAIDGSPSTNYMSGRCSHTDLDVEPWWMVDLINVYNITKVKITNRGDCCQERINGAVIIIGNSPENGGTQNSRCAKIKSLGLREEGQYVCGMVGRYITITIPGKAAYLTLCEVKVYGTNVSEQYTGAPSKPYLYDSEEQQRDNLAFRGITSQSSTYDKLGASENAIDGSPSTNYMSGRCSHTDLDVEPWWMVDLINVYNITKVKITNRGDCCQERINGAVIIIGNSPENGGTQNSRCAKIKSLGLREEGQYVCGMVGRYITITIPGKAAYLTLCEVKVYGTNVSEQYTGAPSKPDLYDSEEQQLATELRNIMKHSNAAPNVAMHLPTKQSSTDCGESHAANDGNLKKCFKTAVEKTPWWTLELPSDHKVFSIAVTSQNDSSAQDLHEAEIHIGSSATGWKKNPICGKMSTIGPGETFSFNCDGLVGRFVTIVIPDKKASLSLCEVQVFALSVDTPSGDWNTDLESQKSHHGVKNLAPQGIPSQSSYYGKRSEVRTAIDGSLSSNYNAGECTHTRKELRPWWNLDLKSSYRISSVAITNRGDCCPERINGAQILIGDSAENGGIGNPRCGVVLRINYGETLSFDCKGMEGRYVTVVIPDQNQYLTLCEVQVFGELAEIAQEQGKVEVIENENLSAVTSLEGRYFLFPEESVTDYVLLTPNRPMSLTSFTLCMKLALNVSENRETILFSYRTLFYDELNLWQESNGNVGFYMSGEGLMFPKLDHSKEWNHLCLTWESRRGRCELWINGRRSGNKLYRRRHTVRAGGIAILGQDQDELGNGFEKSQSYVGKIKELNMWNKVLSIKSLRKVFNGNETPKGEVFDWSNLSYSTKGNVKVI